MGIGGINDYSNFISNYRIQNIPTVSVEDVKRQDAGVQSAPQEAQRPVVEDIPLSRPRQDAALEDISLTFNRGDDYGYIGRDSDITSLDEEKAMSDMARDQVLQQYQFFVGSSVGPLVDNADGIVVPKL